MESISRPIAIIETRYGTLAIDTERDQKMAHLLLCGGYPNQELIEIMRAFIPARGVIIDAGAHIGTFTIALTSSLNKVIAFEPAPATFALLERNLRSRVGVDVRNKGLGSQDDYAHVQERNASNAGAQTLLPGGTIPIVRLDDELVWADALKIDVEGMELEILEGASRLIQEARPVILFEVNLSQLRAHGASPSDIAHFFRIREYRLFLPIFGQRTILSEVHNLSLLTALVAPRAWLFRGESAPFDVFAIPRERSLPLPYTGFSKAIRQVVGHNLAIKAKRYMAFFRSIF